MFVIFPFLILFFAKVQNIINSQMKISSILSYRTGVLIDLGCSSVTECLPGVHEGLDSIHSNAEDGEGA